MRKIFISMVFVCVALFVGVSIGILIKNKNNNSQSKTESGSTAPKSTVKKFAWGGYSNPYVLLVSGQPFNTKNVDGQIPYFKDLGINTVRFNYEFDPAKPDVVRPENKYLIDKLIDNDIDRYMVVESPLQGDEFFKNASYDNGFAWGKKIATQYKGKVNYYQMLNEVSGMAIRKNFSGFNATDYDENKYRAIKYYLQGMSTAIRSVDPQAKLVVNANWLGAGIIDRLISDNVNFDVIGWNWFSDMGDDITNHKMEDGSILNIPQHFKNTGKKFFITEMNLQGGSFDSKEQEQADYLSKAITNAQKSNMVSGIFVFTLFDQLSGNGGTPTKDNEWGLVTNKLDIETKTWVFGEKKKAFNIYRDLILRSGTGMSSSSL